MFSNFNKNRTEFYFICQATGWGLYVLLYSFLTFMYQGFNLINFSMILLSGILGFLLTHLFRAKIKKDKWFDYSVSKLVGKVTLVSITFSIIIVGIIFPLLLILSEQDINSIKLASILANVLQLSLIIILWSLIYFSVHYFQNYKRSEIERLVWEAAVKDFELKTLKSQLNPHFMFNALNSIRALIEENPERAKSAITQLSNIFRYSLRIERQETVPLEEEIQTVVDYLALEQIRFEERLKYNVTIDPKSKRIEIPPMMIQTLVENGIKHGISKRQEGGLIDVSTKVNETMLEIIIKNSGYYDEKDSKISNGYGVNNTKQRLNLIYSEKGTFSIFNDKGYVNAIIKIPIEGITL